ncbi:hypothetical protein ACT009_02085 [Sphingomonas sp. Tas61C01]|uniref:hypothetical protein n=1 Tax=Sphingomonas sp. Tas61C01 TaxID=3458297 RepID=UPI00403E9DCF
MSTIQLDMFEVQLGAAILLQMRSGDDIVRILADGGVTRHPASWVHDKLPKAVADFEPVDRIRLDLIIGTHYDADHLDGLVPIIEDENIDIGETWLPPVANDATPHSAEDTPTDSHLLALQFARDDGDETLRAYLVHKAHVCETIAELERQVSEGPLHELQAFLSSRELDESRIDEDPRGYFEQHLRSANETLGDQGHGHADDEITDTRLPDEVPSFLYVEEGIAGRQLLRRWEDNPPLAAKDARSLAFIRKSAAKDAINATSLNAVVKALKDRKLPIRSATINDGAPRRFVWDKAERRFYPSANNSSDGPVLTLLGPSDGLVKKHWDRLPVGSYLALATYARLPVKSITPSNQLSYVVRVALEEQNVLISGDAGLVDFASGRNQYHQPLIDELAPLHVVQVAHHGGLNAHFYNALLASGYATQTAPSYLLLSHATNDASRPSGIFAKFVELIRAPQRSLTVLFTATPQEPFVRDYKKLIGPVRGGAPEECGDVRLEFGDRGWNLVQHLVQV